MEEIGGALPRAPPIQLVDSTSSALTFPSSSTHLDVYPPLLLLVCPCLAGKSLQKHLHAVPIRLLHFFRSHFIQTSDSIRIRAAIRTVLSSQLGRSETPMSSMDCPWELSCLSSCSIHAHCAPCLPRRSHDSNARNFFAVHVQIDTLLGTSKALSIKLCSAPK
jgi:hypothetical protein